jgi:3-oxoacyl-[acyl-carrier protein] reductase
VTAGPADGERKERSMAVPERGPLAGRVALVTGASGGIGGAIARRLAAEDADLVLVHGRHREDAQQVAQSLPEHRGRIALLGGDLADPDTPTELVRQAADRFGCCDLLVCSAGTGTKTAWDQLDLASWDQAVAVNLRSPWLLSQAALPGMLERGFGRILYISSVAALNGGVIGAHYAASKAGLAGLMHHLAPRVAGRGVTVNTIAPGPIAGTRIVPVDAADPAALPLPVPVGRLGTTDEVADLALAVLRNGYLTDKTYSLDGGIVPS